MQPLEIKVLDNHEILISWPDQHRSLFSPMELRFSCQCASCCDEHTGRRMIQKKNIADDIRLLKWEPVGHYGLKIHWSDGHSTGIYSHEYLRSLCPCSTCQAAPKPTTPL